MIRDMLRTRLADALAHTLATKPFELTPGEDLERQVNLAMADAVLVVVAEWLRAEATADTVSAELEGLVGMVFMDSDADRATARLLAALADSLAPPPA